MRVIMVSLTAVLLATTAGHGQDIFRPLQELVDELTAPQPAPRSSERATPRPVPPAAPTAATERPDEAGDAEAVEDEPPLPRPRPEEAQEPPAPEPEREAEEPLADEEPAEPEPEPAATAEPDRIYQTACPALLSGAISGEMLDPLADGICEQRSPLSVTAVSVNGRSVPLSSPVTTNCEVATAFADWVGEVDAYADAALDSPVATVTTGTSFMCRNRVGGESGFVSEHGFANALDIVGFALEDGRTISVEADWMPATTPEARLLRQAHGAACGRFTTVLGPEANAEHEDHLHLDLGCHGQSCTAQICE